MRRYVVVRRAIGETVIDVLDFATTSEAVAAIEELRAGRKVGAMMKAESLEALAEMDLRVKIFLLQREIEAMRAPAKAEEEEEKVVEAPARPKWSNGKPRRG
jgi:hypothetical protein